MSRFSRGGAARRSSTFLAASVFLAIAGLIVVSALSERARRDAVLREARDAMLYMAVLIGQDIESTLVSADIVLEDLDAFSASAASAPVLSDIVRAAEARMPRSSNLYILDERGAVLLAARPRRSPSFEVDGSELERIGRGSGLAVVVAQAPAEGGTVIAAVRPLGSMRGLLAAAIFSSSFLQERLFLLMRTAVTEVDIGDEYGGVYRRRLEAESGFRAEAPTTQAAYFLQGFPLTVTTRRDIDSILADWRRHSLALAAVLSGFAAVVAALFLYGAAQERRARAAVELGRELELKNSLFAEVNHRVKNNLMVAQSILGLGEEAVEERPETALETLRSAQDRLRSMSLLHEQLYKRSSLAATDFGAYLRDLVEALDESYRGERQIATTVEAPADLSLSLNRSVPLGLIVSELVTNAYKYAFPDGRQGRIRLAAAPDERGGLRIVVEDDGIGCGPRGKGESPPGSGFGLGLVELLAQQVEAGLAMDCGDGGGTSWTISIPPDRAGAQGPSIRA